MILTVKVLDDGTRYPMTFDILDVQRFSSDGINAIELVFNTGDRCIIEYDYDNFEKLWRDEKANQEQQWIWYYTKNN